MSSLADFYGIAPVEPTTKDEPAGGGTPDHEVDQTQTHISAAPTTNTTNRSAKFSLDSSEFDATTYLHRLLKHSTMRDLIQHDNSMIASKRSLDSEMQTLVYENYNKFISATDMIRKMKSNVESMEVEMSHLLTNMNQISKNCHELETSLTPNRAKVENLLGVSRLLKRLEFLFELPDKLRRSIKLGAYEQAVRYFKISSSILEQYQHHKSFEHIRTESEGIISQLKVTLRGLIKDASLSSEQQMSYTGMLVLDLSEPDSDELMKDLIEQQRKKFQAQINKAVDLANKASSLRKSSISGEQKAKEASDSSDFNPSSSPSTSSHDSSNLLTLLHQHFLTPYIIFTDTFLSTLVRPYQEKQQKLQLALADQRQQLVEQQHEAKERAAANKGKSTVPPPSTANVDATTLALHHLTQSLNLSHNSLVGLTADLFNVYFTLARRELVKRATIQPTDDASQIILQFTATLKTFYAGLTKLIQLLPQAKLSDRIQELIHHALTHCVEAVCEHVLNSCVAKLADAHSQVLAWRPGTLNFPSPASTSTQLRQLVEDGFGLLVVVLSTGEYLPESVASGFSFTELARAHATQLLTQLAKEISYRTCRRSDGGQVYDTPTIANSLLSRMIEERLTKRITGVSSERDARIPFFYLFLCQVSHQQATKDIAVALQTLSKFFPSSPPLRGRKAEVDHLLPDLVAKSKENTQALLLRYCETHGFQVTEIVRMYLISPTNSSSNSSPDPKHPSEFVDRLESEFHRISLELGLVFPRARDDSQSTGGGHMSHDSSGRDLLGTGGRGVNTTGGRNPAGGSQKDKHRSGPGINRDIQRLFTQKITTFSGVDISADGVGATHEMTMNHIQPMVAICKIAFKAMMETVRMERLTASTFHQLQLDVFTLRHELSAFFETNYELVKVLNVLLDETITSAHDRANNVPIIEEYILSEAYETSRAQRPPSYTTTTTTPTSNDQEVTDQDHPSTSPNTSTSQPPTAVPSSTLARLVLSPKS